jgi:hypothetical protein
MDLIKLAILRSDSAVEKMRDERNKNPYHAYMDKLPRSKTSLDDEEDNDLVQVCHDISSGYAIPYHPDHGEFMGKLFYYEPENIFVALQLRYMELTGIIKAGSCEELISRVLKYDWGIDPLWGEI